MRRGIALAGALGLALTLAACSSETPSASPTPTPSESESEASPSPTLTGTLTMWVDETRIEAFPPIVEDFEAETGIQIELVQKASGDIRTEFVAQVPTGQGPDVVIGAHDWTGEFVTNGVVAPVELGDKAGTLSPSTVAAFAYDGQQYGVPYALENIALVRNNALVSETPATFDELIAQNETTGAELPVIIQQGENGDAYHLYPLQTSFGAPVFVQNADGSYTNELGMGGEPGTAFANYLAALGDSGVLDTAINGDQAKELFLDGKSPYMITGPWYATEFAAADMDISVLPVPSAGGQEAQPFVGAQGAFISARSANPLLANEFVVNYLTRADVQTKLYELGGRVPAVTESAAAIDDPLLVGFNEAGATGAPMPSIPEMGAVWGFWGTTQVQIITGQASDPAAAWETMNANITDAIASS